MNECLFEKSRFYKSAVAKATSVIAPIGYSFLGKDIKKNVEINKTGEIKYKYINDKPTFKIIPGRKTISEKLKDFFQLTELQRKSHYISSTISEFLEKEVNSEVLNLIISQYIPNMKSSWHTLELAQLITNPGIDSLFHIEDYSLSQYFFIYEGSHLQKVDYLNELINRRLIQYPIQTLYINWNGASSEMSERNIQQMNKIDITNKNSVHQLINLIWKRNVEKDPLFTGIHFYYGDCSSLQSSISDLFQTEISNYQIVQYFVTMITGLLAEGQSTVIKLNGCFRQKTCEYIFLLKLAFNGKLTLVKPYGSNPFTPESYLICEYFNAENGRKVHQYLMENYELLREYGEDKLLLNSVKIFRQGIFDIIKSFNDSMMKSLQYFLKQFKTNSNMVFYPSKAKIIDKIPSKFCIYEELVKMVDEVIPGEDVFEQEGKKKKKEDIKEKKVIEKQGNTSLLDIFTTSVVSEKKKVQKSMTQKQIKKEKNYAKEILEQIQKQKLIKKQKKHHHKSKRNKES